MTAVTATGTDVVRIPKRPADGCGGVPRPPGGKRRSSGPPRACHEARAQALGLGTEALYRATPSRISFFASSAPTHVEMRTHLPGSRSL